MADRELAGRVALVTGGGRGIGRAIALALAHAGAHVGINYLHAADGAEATAERCRAEGVRAIAVRADVSGASAVRTMVQSVDQDLGPVDILVNNAAIITGERLLGVTEELWDSILGINLKGVFLCTQAVAAGMLRRERGCVVNLASAWGIDPGAGGMHPGVPYVASKGGVVSLTRALAYELRPHVRVNAIAPGLIDSKPGMFDEAGRRRGQGRSQLGRIGTPEDVADVAVFLASDRSRFITGQILGVDGGLD